MSLKDPDPNVPEEHFVPFLRNMPLVAGSGVITSPSILQGISKHLWEAGCAHRDYLESLADENGMIHVSKLPRQVHVFQPAFRGPHHFYNNAARWVPKGTPPPKPVILPDIKELTQQENAVMLKQYRDAGYLDEKVLDHTPAETLNEGH